MIYHKMSLICGRTDSFRMLVMLVVVVTVVLASCSESSNDDSNKPTLQNTEGLQSESELYDFAKSIEAHSQDPNVYVARGKWYAENGETTKALQDFKQALILDSAHSEAYFCRSQAYAELLQYDLAEADCNEVIARESDNVEFCQGCAHIYYAQENYVLAVELLTQGISLELNSPSLYLDRAMAYLALDNKEAALADLKIAIQLDSKLHSAYTWRGLVYQALGQTTEALSDFKYAIDLKPDYDFGHLILARYYAAEGSYESALESYNRALEINPGLVEAYRERAWIYSRLDMPDKALSDREVAAMFNPETAGVVVGNYDLDVTHIWQTPNASQIQPDEGRYLVVDFTAHNYDSNELCLTRDDFALLRGEETARPNSDDMRAVRDEYYPGVDYPGGKAICVEPNEQLDSFVVFDTPPDLSNLKLVFEPQEERIDFEMLMRTRDDKEYDFALWKVNGEEVLKIVDVQFTDTIDRLYSIDRVSAWNCPDFGVVKPHSELSKSKSRETHFFTSTGFGAEFSYSFPALPIALEVQSYHERTSGESVADTISHQLSYDFEASPDQFIWYEVVWMIVARNGEIVFEANDRQFTMPFEFEEDIRVEVRTKEQMSCEDAEDIITGGGSSGP